MELEQILKIAVRGGASDVILKAGAVPKFRLHGNLVPLSDGIVVTAELMQAWINEILPAHHKDKLGSTIDIDFAHQTAKGNRFRINLFRQRQNFGLVARVISNHVRSAEELQLPSILSNFAQEKRGLILVTGATGSGKSTTLAAIIQKINQERPAHILTIEDPIEYVFEDNVATVNQREIGIDSLTFADALRSALRQNPDVILVGELRDKETTETALMAAETGHLVFSTLHTMDAVESLTRLMAYFPPHQHVSLRIMLAHTLRAIVSQRLVQCKDGRGRTAAIEVLIANALVKDTILNGANFDPIYNAIQTGGETYGMQSFDQSLINLYQQGVISVEEALAQASNKDDMELQLRGFSR